MSLSLPQKSDYEEVASEIIHTATNSGLEGVVYGSFIKRNFKPGLSDIDALIYSHVDRWMFPPQFQEIFAWVTARANALLIPLQLSWVTQKSLSPNSFFSKDPWYLSEVKKGLASPYKTSRIEAVLPKTNGSKNEHDRAMLRFFHQKLQRLGSLLPLLETIVSKNDTDITQEELRILQEAWDVLKKWVHVAALSRRIQRQKPSFSEWDILAIHENWFSEYVGLLQRVQSMQDWIMVLREKYARKKIEWIILLDFEILILSVESALWNKK